MASCGYSFWSSWWAGLKNHCVPAEHLNFWNIVSWSIWGTCQKSPLPSMNWAAAPGLELQISVTRVHDKHHHPPYCRNIQSRDRQKYRYRIEKADTKPSGISIGLNRGSFWVSVSVPVSIQTRLSALYRKSGLSNETRLFHTRKMWRTIHF